MNKTDHPITDSNSLPTLSQQSMERYRAYLDKAEYQALLSELENPLPPAVRPNMLKTQPESALNKWIKSYGWEVRKIPYYDAAVQVLSSKGSIGRTIEHQMGEYYIQDAASLLPVSLLDEPDGYPELILDMAAAPGGKTTQLIDRYGDKSLVIANDSSASRLQALRVVLQNWGSLNHAITNFPGEQIGNWFPDCFDIILLDAPCTMENLRPTKSHPARETSKNERLRLQMRQVQLLISAFLALKPGGQLIYATCSLAPEEDEAVLTQLLEAYPEVASIENCSKIGINAPGLSSFEGQIFHHEVKNALRLWPHIALSSGFFAAKIRKNTSVSSGQKRSPERPFYKTGFKPVSIDDQTQIQTQLLDDFGLDIEKIFFDFGIELFYRDTTIYGIPRGYLSRFSRLPFFNLGFLLGKLIKNEFIPSHDFFNRFGYQFTHGSITLPDALVDNWMKGQDIRNWEIPPNISSRTCLVVDENGRNLGGGRILEKRLRNLLPAYTLLTS